VRLWYQARLVKGPLTMYSEYWTRRRPPGRWYSTRAVAALPKRKRLRVPFGRARSTLMLRIFALVLAPTLSWRVGIALPLRTHALDFINRPLSVWIRAHRNPPRGR